MVYTVPQDAFRWPNHLRATISSPPLGHPRRRRALECSVSPKCSTLYSPAEHGCSRSACLANGEKKASLTLEKTFPANDVPSERQVAIPTGGDTQTVPCHRGKHVIPVPAMITLTPSCWGVRTKTQDAPRRARPSLAPSALPGSPYRRAILARPGRLNRTACLGNCLSTQA